MKFQASILWILWIGSVTAFAQEQKPSADPAELAKKLSNPIASLISVPFQNNTDYGIGPNTGTRNTLNFQPVIPIRLSANLNLIARVVLPVISQYNTTGTGEQQSGLGDAVVSGFFSPAHTKLIWGIGPALLVPTATNNLLGTQKFGVGPTAVILNQSKGFTYGALANQIWSVAGDANRSDVNQMFVQPFITYNWKSGAGLGASGEITQNWIANTTTAFIIPTLSGVTRLGSQIVSIAFGPRLAVSAPSGAKPEMGWRGTLTFVFPK